MEPFHFSEFSYGYALTDELIHWHGTPLTAAPVFPSLQKEGQPGGGYDVKLNRPHAPLFLQFKLTDRMERANAKEAKAGILARPFYRMHLRPASRSNQHQLLIDLENQGNEVYYAAPAFYETMELNVAYSRHQMVHRSVFIRPSAIRRLPDGKKHHVSFQKWGAPHGYFLSDPLEATRVEITPGSALSERMIQELQRLGRQDVGPQFLWKLADGMTRIIHERIGDEFERERISLEETRRELTPLRQVAYFARTFFDCSFFLVSRKEGL